MLGCIIFNCTGVVSLLLILAIVFEVLSFIVMGSISRFKTWLSMRISSLMVEWLFGLAVAMGFLIA